MNRLKQRVIAALRQQRLRQERLLHERALRQGKRRYWRRALVEAYGPCVILVLDALRRNPRTRAIGQSESCLVLETGCTLDQIRRALQKLSAAGFAWGIVPNDFLPQGGWRATPHRRLRTNSLEPTAALRPDRPLGIGCRHAYKALLKQRGPISAEELARQMPEGYQLVESVRGRLCELVNWGLAVVDGVRLNERGQHVCVYRAIGH